MTERTHIDKTLGYRTYLDRKVDGSTQTKKHAIEGVAKRNPTVKGGNR